MVLILFCADALCFFADHHVLRMGCANCNLFILFVWKLTIENDGVAGKTDMRNIATMISFFGRIHLAITVFE